MKAEAHFKKKYKPLTCEQSVEIHAHLKTDRSLSQIAGLIDVSKSMVSRELRRNQGLKGHRFRQTQEKALSRRRGVDKRIHFTARIKTELIDRLKDD